MNEIAETLASKFARYRIPHVTEFLDANAFERGDDAVVRWSKAFLKRNLRANDQHELCDALFSISPKGFAYLFPIWLRESLLENWTCDAAIYTANEFIFERHRWNSLSDEFAVFYTNEHLGLVSEAMLAVSELEHFEDVRDSLRKYAKELAAIAH
ncbi:MAG: hypothetical protein AAFV37_12690 [Pseudomonadota bacterium]